MIEPNDWRLQGQENYLTGVELKYVNPYKQFSETWDHDHCDFCWETFSIYEGDSHEGYATLDEKAWVCLPCFEDFKEMFQWEVVETEGQ